MQDRGPIDTIMDCVKIMDRLDARIKELENSPENKAVEFLVNLCRKKTTSCFDRFALECELVEGFPCFCFSEQLEGGIASESSYSLITAVDMAKKRFDTNE